MTQPADKTGHVNESVHSTETRTQRGASPFSPLLLCNMRYIFCTPFDILNASVQLRISFDIYERKLPMFAHQFEPYAQRLHLFEL